MHSERRPAQPYTGLTLTSAPQAPPPHPTHPFTPFTRAPTQLINVACDDPGAAIGAQLALPLLMERLDSKALEYAAARAREAEDEVMRMEVGGVICVCGEG